MSVLLERLRQRVERRLSRRDAQLRLTLGNLYILPTGFGGLWLLGTAVLYLLGINTSSNGPLLLAFLCTGLFLLSLFLTQFNLQGLILKTAQPPPGFAGQLVTYPIQLNSGCERHGLRLEFRHQPLQLQPCIKAGLSWCSPCWRPVRRGLQSPGRLKLSSKAPLGLFVCWSYWEPPEPQLIYPAAVAGPVLEHWEANQEMRDISQGSVQPGGAEDFRELKPHRPEEGLQRVAWKQLARGRGWLSKSFESPAEQQRILALDLQVPLEQGLEHLCARILELEQLQEGFALQLPNGLRMSHGHGRAHTESALRALAQL